MFLWSYTRQSLFLLFFIMLAKKVTLYINYVTLFPILLYKLIIFYLNFIYILSRIFFSYVVQFIYFSKFFV